MGQMYLIGSGSKSGLADLDGLRFLAPFDVVEDDAAASACFSLIASLTNLRFLEEQKLKLKKLCVIEFKN